MNKVELIDLIVLGVGLFKVDVKKVLDVFVDVIVVVLKKGDCIFFVGFGFFLVFKCEVRIGCNL